MSAVNNMKCSVLCLLTVAFVPLLSTLEVSSNKAGVCPLPILNPDARHGVCRKQCSSDKECPGNMKCCFNGCGLTCVNPLRVCKPKPGSCPVQDRDPVVGYGICINKCTSDDDCVKNLKCCPSRCGKTCQEPVMVRKPKPGSCPVPKGFGICISSCTSDQECEKNLKCCSNGCGKTCQEPVKKEKPTKPGSCPVPKPHFHKCDDQCTDDHQCERNLKCCYSGCGNECMTPVHFFHSPKEVERQ